MADPGILVVSNRGPKAYALGADTRPVEVGSAGGMAGTLEPVVRTRGVTWIAAAMSDGDRQAFAAGLTAEEDLRLVLLDVERETYAMAYDVVSSATLWFVHHGLFDLPRRPRFDRHWHRAWDAYRATNEQFADAVVREAGPDAVVLVQDYHLALLGGMLRDRRPDLRTVHFSHTPFADAAALRCLPTAVTGEIVAGMGGFGACGFHSARWAAAFRESVDAPTFVSPLAPTLSVLKDEVTAAEAEGRLGQLDAELVDRQVIVRVDRIEPSKNILRGFWAYEELLATRSEWHGKVVFLALVYGSRMGLAEYQAYRSEVVHTAERINAAWGTPEWTPILLDTEDDRGRSVAALARYDVLLVNPVRDGLNLVAKEGPLVNRTDGIVVLSREAGAFDELGDAVLGCNPFDVSETAAQIDRALRLSRDERRDLASRLRDLVAARTAADWFDDQLTAAGRA